MKYFGFKLAMLTTLEGVPIGSELVPASADEREAAEEVLAFVHDCDTLGDEGIIGADWQHGQHGWHGNRIWTVKQKNQKEQNPPDFDRWLNSIREHIEGVFNGIQNTGRNRQRLLAKTVRGLCTRVIAKMASHALKAVLRRFFDIDVQIFNMVAD